MHPNFVARYNVAPSTRILAIRDTEAGRTGSMVRWGLIPPWAKDASKMPMLNNARGETAAEKPMFRHAFHRRRCIIPVSGFYEWKTVPGQKVKQPFYISFKDGTPMALAGIWEHSKLPDGDGFLDTCTILTTGPNAVMEPIHNRMPVILDRDAWDTWLTPEPTLTDVLLALVKPFDAEKMRAWCVSTEVNRAVNDARSLIEEVATA